MDQGSRIKEEGEGGLELGVSGHELIWAIRLLAARPGCEKKKMKVGVGRGERRPRMSVSERSLASWRGTRVVHARYASTCNMMS